MKEEEKEKKKKKKYFSELVHGQREIIMIETTEEQAYFRSRRVRNVQLGRQSCKIAMIFAPSIVPLES